MPWMLPGSTLSTVVGGNFVKLIYSKGFLPLGQDVRCDTEVGKNDYLVG